MVAQTATISPPLKTYTAFKPHLDLLAGGSICLRRLPPTVILVIESFPSQPPHLNSLKVAKVADEPLAIMLNNFRGLKPQGRN